MPPRQASTLWFEDYVLPPPHALLRVEALMFRNDRLEIVLVLEADGNVEAVYHCSVDSIGGALGGPFVRVTGVMGSSFVTQVSNAPRDDDDVSTG